LSRDSMFWFAIETLRDWLLASTVSMAK
jgi:hypothetical protein